MFAALGGTSYAAGSALTGDSPAHHQNAAPWGGGVWANHLGGLPAAAYMLSKHSVSSHGVQFLGLGQTMTLGKSGHFTFTASCSNDPNGAQSVTFAVTSDDTADLDGNGPMPAGSVVKIHVDSDQADTTPQNALNAGDFAQVASASSSTEIGADGQEADIFYTDGVNWGGSNGIPAHACFAGYTGFLYGHNDGGLRGTNVNGGKRS